MIGVPYIVRTPDEIGFRKHWIVVTVRFTSGSKEVLV